MPLCLAHTLATGAKPCGEEAAFISDTRLPVCASHRLSLESADRILRLLKPTHLPLTFTPIDEPEEFVSIVCARLEFRLLVHALSAVSHFANADEPNELVSELTWATSAINQLGKARWNSLLSQLVKLAPAFPGVTVQTREPDEPSYTPTESPD